MRRIFSLTCRLTYMLTHALICGLVTIFLIGAVPAYAQDASHDTEKERSGSWDRTMEQRKGRSNSYSAEVELSTKALFGPVIVELEKDTEPFKSCRLFSSPPLAAEFGITAEIEPGVIDVYKAQYLEQAARSGSSTSGILNKKRWKNYLKCLGIYGAVIGQAHDNLVADIKDVTQTTERAGEIQIKGMDGPGLFVLAAVSVDRAVTVGINDPNIRALFKLVNSSGADCRFAGGDYLQCGPVFVRPGKDAEMTVAGTVFFGPAYAGRTGKFRTAKSEDRVKAAVATKKRSWNSRKKADQKANPTRWIPGLGN